MTRRHFSNIKTMGAVACACSPGYSLESQEEHVSLRVEQPGQCCETPPSPAHRRKHLLYGLFLFTVLWSARTWPHWSRSCAVCSQINLSCGCWILPHKCLECGPMSCGWPDDAWAVRFPKRHCTPHHPGCLRVAGPMLLMLLALPWPGSTRRGLAVDGKTSQSLDQDQVCPLFF